MADNINSPNWYACGEIEPIDFLEGSPHLGGHEYAIISYVYRWKAKNGVEDLRKAEWWIKRLIALQERKLAAKPIVRHVPRTLP